MEQKWAARGQEEPNSQSKAGGQEAPVILKLIKINGFLEVVTMMAMRALSGVRAEVVATTKQGWLLLDLDCVYNKEI